MKLLENFVKFEAKTVKALDKLIENIFTVRLDKARQFAQDITNQYMLNSKEALSLNFGELAGEFGIPIDAQFDTVESISETIGEYMNVNVSKFPPRGNILRTKISVTLNDTIYYVLIDLPEAVTVTEQNDVLPWLEWLLFEGGKILIKDHHVEAITGKGRSGLAIMVPSSSWQVPSEFQGTINNNWITRTLSDEKYLNELAQGIYNILYKG